MIDVGQALFQETNVGIEWLQDEAVPGGEVAVPGERQVVLFGAQFAHAKTCECDRILSVDEPLDHAPS